ncbi:alpha/beta hydrolase [Nocardioides sp. Root151]|uniref:alpha/beta hydrolase n=1 Tax=Nocardioides sp. Root151 TaxID=1736475 RepID=UPI0007035D8E|nr:alpha/beta hydrolase [Nocardioides sp. Root151]KQZ75593.1 alpha/beta hydrolase [Nocardioides sp. Root151]
MPLDPGISALLQFIESSGNPPMHESSPDDARKAFAGLAQIAVAQSGRIEVGSVVDTSVAGLAARVYRPAVDGPVPTVVFFHGGGWVVGDIETHENTCRRLCRDTSSVVVSVDYRVAPEHAFPAAVDDALAAATAISEDLAAYGGSDVWAVAGDSAGGNLSAVVAQQVPGVAAQLLIYPAVDVFGDYASRESNGTGYFLELPLMEWFLGHYLQSAAAPDDARLSPLHGVRPELAPAIVVTAEFDPLRDEGRAYADALAASGVPVDSVTYDGLIHGFVDMPPFSPAADAAVADMNRRFAALLH